MSLINLDTGYSDDILLRHDAFVENTKRKCTSTDIQYRMHTSIRCENKYLPHIHHTAYIKSCSYCRKRFLLTHLHNMHYVPNFSDVTLFLNHVFYIPNELNVAIYLFNLVVK